MSLFHLASTPPHSFGTTRRIAPDASSSGHEQFERTCASCGAVKISVVPHHGAPYRAWRTAGAPRQWVGAAPRCRAAEMTESVA